MGKREDTESGYYLHGRTEYCGGIWVRYDTWYGNDGVSRDQQVCAYGEDDNSDIYRGLCVYRCPCCYLNLFHTEEYHRAHVKDPGNG